MNDEAAEPNLIELINKLLDNIGKIAFDIPTMNIYTPQIVSNVIQAKQLLNNNIIQQFQIASNKIANLNTNMVTYENQVMELKAINEITMEQYSETLNRYNTVTDALKTLVIATDITRAKSSAENKAIIRAKEIINEIENPVSESHPTEVEEEHS